MSEDELKINQLFTAALFSKIDGLLQKSQKEPMTPLEISNKIFKVLDAAKKEVNKGSVIGNSQWFKKWFGNP